MSSSALPLLASRGSEGVKLIHSENGFLQQSDLFCDEEAKGKIMKFSEDGGLFGFCNGQKLKVLDMSDGGTAFETPKQKTLYIKFSPKNTYLACWELFYTSPQLPEGFDNFEIFNIKTKAVVKKLKHKKQSAWEPRWSKDEKICGRCVSNEIQFHQDGDFSTVAHKLHIQGIENFTISPAQHAPYIVAVYIPGKKGAPSCVRMFQYPNFGNGQAITNKSFFKSDKVDMFWNNKGTGMLVLVSAEVDTTGKTYYGEQSLHFMTSKGESSLVPLDKKGPIYSVEWHPDSSHFCVVYGYMPAKAALFNMKAEPIFDFGTGARSTCSYNAHGNILCLAGFGNLPGEMEMWNVEARKLVCKPKASDTTFFQWCPDGQHLVTATCAPRLRVNNGYKIWHYTGKVVATFNVKPNGELFEAFWQNQPKENYPAPKVSTTAYVEVKQQAYRPPSARGQPVKKLAIHEHEKPSNQRVDQQQNMSANALKNKKKREAKARAKQETAEPGPVPPSSTNQSAGSAAPSGDLETDKKIKGLKKKLRQIEDLKTKQKEGKTLEKNQLDKIASEKEILDQLSQLQVS
eukprot:TCONS_00020590-protein